MVVWTGNVPATWQALKTTPGFILNWGLAGAPYVACDIGGYSPQTNALLLARWYGLGAFLPIMRIHSINGTKPHFPFAEVRNGRTPQLELTLHDAVLLHAPPFYYFTLQRIPPYSSVP